VICPTFRQALSRQAKDPFEGKRQQRFYLNTHDRKTPPRASSDVNRQLSLKQRQQLQSHGYDHNMIAE